MKLIPHINFGGQCRAAFTFYERALQGRVETMLTWSESPMCKDIDPSWYDKICHATLTVGNNEIAGVDDPFEPQPTLSGFQLIVEASDPLDAERIFGALEQNGTVKLPLRKTFWAARYGIVKDQFGVAWEINCAVQD